MLRITIRALRAQQLFKVSEPEYLDKVRDLEMWKRSKRDLALIRGA